MERNERKANSRNHSITIDRDSKFLLRKVILDFSILFVVGFLILVFYLWGAPYERGFFCDDESLKHPYKESTVTNVMLYIVGLGLPVVTVCRPDIDCTLPENKWRYIEQFTCLGQNPKLMKEMRLSFPSGHSSFSAYTMFYFAIYLQKRFLWRGSKLLRHGIQFLLIMMAWYTVMTRVSDYKHHWSDVLAGFSIGLLYAIVVYAFVSDLRKSSRRAAVNHDSELTTNGTRGAGWSV